MLYLLDANALRISFYTRNIDLVRNDVDITP
jgi:hypothetical protein